MPETAYIQQAIVAKKQAQQAQNNHKKTAMLNFAMQMQQAIYARQLETMRGSLGV